MGYQIKKIHPPTFEIHIGDDTHIVNEYELRTIQIDIKNGVLNPNDVYIKQRPDLEHVEIVGFHEDGRFDNKVKNIDLSYKLVKKLL